MFITIGPPRKSDGISEGAYFSQIREKEKLNQKLGLCSARDCTY